MGRGFTVAALGVGEGQVMGGWKEGPFPKVSDHSGGLEL